MICRHCVKALLAKEGGRRLKRLHALVVNAADLLILAVPAAGLCFAEHSRVKTPLLDDVRDIERQISAVCQPGSEFFRCGK